MTEDARFEEGGERPLRLRAEDADDLQVISALTQDAVFPASEIAWRASERRLALLINRFRWEDKPRAERRGRPVERVQSMLVIDDVLKVRSAGVQRGDADTILSILSLNFAAGEDGSGTVELILAGDGAIAAQVECLNVTLQDVTRPYLAPSRKAPSHD
ncbi:conserved hypothetical protein [Dinoroseobacter shibae DFL 12 = DSM 16493]|jgi:hypothetical protein|uniref:DUF2948 family protein n=1 Tax=Dinoroseobacter shibae (strain DSM 16493 / NCIMB 14021 / DFL 12) TaxID=398580 RepID=A8LS13_DINSH|nr:MULTISPECIES: DUF2948 family protein [Dinoroseobacter]ABV92720.1 conserved hypothetical protein [Dinoroseobacter shibae DFL 12 = DSM 16493]MDD9715794.1 DUF2948 family protein [Dinoroseobacter sp. PD6]URF47660.1 DUF2948 family protein [Dinoroseobacter shibae]URF51970.1 DUF2948 family protein [Dinoroseobacter shibae]